MLDDGRNAWVKNAAAGCRDDPPRAGGSPTRRRGGASAGANCAQALTHSVSVGAPLGADLEEPCAGGTEGGDPNIRLRQSARAQSTESGEPVILERDKESARGSEGGKPETLHVRIRRERVRGPGLAGDEEERVGIGLHIAIVPRSLLDGGHEAAAGGGGGGGGSSVGRARYVLVKGVLAGRAAAAHGCLPGDR